MHSVAQQMLLLRLLIFVRVIKHFLFDCDIDLQWSLPPSDCFNECLSDLAMSVQRMRDACEGEKKSPTTILNNQKMALSQCYFNTWKNCDACLKSEWPLDKNGENCWILAKNWKNCFAHVKTKCEIYYFGKAYKKFMLISQLEQCARCIISQVRILCSYLEKYHFNQICLEGICIMRRERLLKNAKIKKGEKPFCWGKYFLTCDSILRVAPPSSHSKK